MSIFAQAMGSRCKTSSQSHEEPLLGFSAQRSHRVVLLGLDGAGKTSLLEGLKLDGVVNTTPVCRAQRREL